MSNKKAVVDWKKKFYATKDIGPEPELNKEGFWKQYKTEELKIGKLQKHKG